MKLLLTGFEAFGGKSINASQQLVLALRDEHFPGVDLYTTILPVDHQHGPAKLLTTFNEVRPDITICLGEAHGRMRLSIERIAINLLDFRIADNSGRQISDAPVVTDGPAAYFVTLPVRNMLETTVAHHIPAELSLSAGAFLCNQVTYALLHEVATQGLSSQVGFIHLPLLPEQAAREAYPTPSLSLDTMQEGLKAIITMLTTR